MLSLGCPLSKAILDELMRLLRIVSGTLLKGIKMGPFIIDRQGSHYDNFSSKFFAMFRLNYFRLNSDC